jgi:tetratricopeptide (TPR) repeat protein
MLHSRWIGRALGWALGLMVLGVVLVGGPAAAESPADIAAARELFKQGVAASKQGNWEEAVDKLSRSLALKRAPIAHYTLGVAQQNTGRLVEALENLRAFLASPREEATDLYREPAQKAIAELEPRVGRVAITIKPGKIPELKVHIDTEAVPAIALDQQRLVNPGSHLVKAEAPGFQSAQKRFEVTEGGSAAVELVLFPEEDKPDEPTLADQPTAPAEPADADAAFPTGPVVLMAGGAAVFGVGLAVGLVGLSEAGDAPSSEGDEADAARAKGLAGDIVAGVGIAAAAAGLIWLIVYDGEPEPEAATSAVRPWSQGSAMGLTLSF